MIPTDSELNPLPSILEPNFVPVSVDLTGGLIEGPGGAISKTGDNKSANYEAGLQGWIIRSNGDVEFNQGVFRGAVTVGSIDIPDTTTASSFHVDTQGNMWIGATTFAAPAPFRISKAGAVDVGGTDTSSWHVDASGNMWWGSAGSFASSSTKISNAGTITLRASASGKGSVLGNDGTLKFYDTGGTLVMNLSGTTDYASTQIELAGGISGSGGGSGSDYEAGWRVWAGGAGITTFLEARNYETDDIRSAIAIDTDGQFYVYESGTEAGAIGPTFQVDGTDGSIVMCGNITSGANSTYNLGAEDEEWAEAYIDKVIGRSALNVIDLSISNRFAINQMWGADSGGARNLGDATYYWGDVSYKTLTDRGCLGWFDEGVELQDGTVVNDTEALQAIQKHPTKLTVYGIPMLDYSTLPKSVYKPATKEVDGRVELLPRDKDDQPYDTNEKGEVLQAQDGAETTALLSIMIGAIKELTLRVQSLESK